MGIGNRNVDKKNEVLLMYSQGRPWFLSVFGSSLAKVS
jgi:hypothetical protein